MQHDDAYLFDVIHDTSRRTFIFTPAALLIACSSDIYYLHKCLSSMLIVQPTVKKIYYGLYSRLHRMTPRQYRKIGVLMSSLDIYKHSITASMLSFWVKTSSVMSQIQVPCRNLNLILFPNAPMQKLSIIAECTEKFS